MKPLNARSLEVGIAVGEALCSLPRFEYGEVHARVYASMEIIEHGASEMRRLFQNPKQITDEQRRYAVRLAGLLGAHVGQLARDGESFFGAVDRAGVLVALDPVKEILLDHVLAQGVDDILVGLDGTVPPPPAAEIRALAEVVGEQQREILKDVRRFDPIGPLLVQLEHYAPLVFEPTSFLERIPDKLRALLDFFIQLGLCALCLRISLWILFRKRMNGKSGFLELFVFLLLLYGVVYFLKKALANAKLVADP